MGNKVERVQTHVSEPQMAQAMIEAWAQLFGGRPTKEQIAILMAQNTLETGARKSMWNYNVGNITTDGKGKWDYWEGLDWLYESLPPDQTGIPQRRKKTIKLKYRAYPNLIEGTKDYLRVISSGRYSKAWQNILNPNVEEYSKALKQMGYYTADEAPYTKGLQSVFNRFIKSKSYETAVANAKVPAEGNQAVSNNSRVSEFLGKLQQLLNKYLSALASVRTNNKFLIKINCADLCSSIEYSRILCEALEEEFASKTYVHSNGSKVEVECEIYGNPSFCKNAINIFCNDLSKTFAHALSKYESVKVNTEVFANKKSARDRTFAEFLASILKDKLIQIYVGDSYEDIKFEQHTMQYPALFCGKVVGAFKECLVLSTPFRDGNTTRLGNILFINERAIRALSEINERSVMSDMFLTSKDAINLYKRFG